VVLRAMPNAGGPRMRIAACVVVGLLALVIAGCGSSTTSTSTVDSGVVTVVVTSPTSGSVIAGTSVVVRGTVSPANATVQIQGQPAPSATVCLRGRRHSTAVRPPST